MRPRLEHWVEGKKKAAKSGCTGCAPNRVGPQPGHAAPRRFGQPRIADEFSWGKLWG